MFESPAISIQPSPSVVESERSKLSVNVTEPPGVGVAGSGVGVLVGVAVLVGVRVGVTVLVGLLVLVGVLVGVTVLVGVGVRVAVGVLVAVLVRRGRRCPAPSESKSPSSCRRRRAVSSWRPA